MIEPKIDEEFELNGKRYKCIQWAGTGFSPCRMCVFSGYPACVIKVSCLAIQRKDGKNVIFKEVEK